MATFASRRGIGSSADNECRGDKILVFHKKRRKGYRKLNGHRQDLTNVVVKEIVIA